MDLFAELQRLGSLIRQLQGALGGRSIATGSSSSVFTASASAADVTIAHGLPNAPTFARATCTNSGLVEWWVVSKDATSIVFRGYTTTNAAVTFTATFDWFAVG
jgi:hypothetical protein